MSIQAISPLDGRYAEPVQPLTYFFSEWALIKFRIHIEVEWLIALSQSQNIPEVRSFTTPETELLR
ncbi:MAG: hypothetical protein JOZ57_15360, partial [Abitibacteriaceae bacterium]|nr:hypothetical protein [Abditibacteriaceae bacterium]